jgi:3-hydroxybutyryl-CoA dehydrogenase
MHFFNPPALMKLVEVVAGEESAELALGTTEEVARRMGRTPVRAADGIGFIANRCARPYSLEALRLLGARIADHEQIDRICRLGGGFRMGPFELTDLVGIDVNFEVAKSFWEQSFHEPRWQPHPIQARMVAAGRLGRKSGRGYYDYSAGDHRPPDPEAPAPASAGSSPPSLVDLMGGSLAALAPAGDAVGYVALPDLETARLVELTRGPSTSEATAESAAAHFHGLGKHVEWVGDAPGLVLGRVVAQLVNEAAFALGAGIGSSADIDTAMRLGFNYPRGPFEWSTAIGPDRVLTVLDALHRELGEERYRAAPALRRAATA